MNPGPALQLIQAHLERGDFNSAEQLIHDARKHSPGELELFRLHARLCYRQNRFEEAAHVLRTALIVHPDSTNDWLRLAHVLAEQGFSADAVQAYAEAARSAPERTELAETAAHGCYQFDQFELAIPFFQTLDEKQPLEGVTLAKFALAAYASSRSDLAFELYQRLAQDNDPVERARGALSCAEMLVDAGMEHLATDAFEHTIALNIDPFSTRASELLAEHMSRASTPQPLRPEFLPTLETLWGRMTNPKRADTLDAHRWLTLTTRRLRGTAPPPTTIELPALESITIYDYVLAWRRRGLSRTHAVMVAWCTLLWLRYMLHHAPWKLYTEDARQDILTGALVSWLQNEPSDAFVAVLAHTEKLLAQEPLRRLLSEPNTLPEPWNRLGSVCGLSYDALEVLVVLTTQALVPVYGAWLDVLELPRHGVPVDELFTLLDPTQQRRGALQRLLTRESDLQRLGFANTWTHVNDLRIFAGLQPSWLDIVTNAPVDMWHSVAPSLTILQPREDAEGRQDLPQLNGHTCVVLYLSTREPELELAALADSLGTLVLVPGELMQESSYQTVLAALLRQCLLERAVVAFEIGEEWLDRVKWALLVWRRYRHPALVWTNDITVAQQASEVLSAPLIRFAGGDDAEQLAPMDGDTALCHVRRSEHSLDALILDEDARSTLNELVQFGDLRDQVYAWGFDKNTDKGRAASALFHGPSGTGKTLATYGVAHAFGLPLFEVDVSRVVSRYIGEAEKRLARIFDVADEGGAVLVFDQADALFSKRTQVRRAGERYANLVVNFLLQRMESYSGIVILTTTRPGVLDSALNRRIRFFVEFKAPDRPVRERLWTRALDGLPIDEYDVDIERLARPVMNGAQIESAALLAASHAMAEGMEIDSYHLERAVLRILGDEGHIVFLSDL